MITRRDQLMSAAEKLAIAARLINEARAQVRGELRASQLDLYHQVVETGNAANAVALNVAAVANES